MFKTKKTPTSTKKVELSPAMVVLQSYTKVTKNVYYKKAALTDLTERKKEINYEIPLLKKQGIAVILVDGKLRKEYLAPGIDPYKARRDLEDALDRENNKNFTTEQENISPKKSSKKTSKMTVKKTINI